MDIWVQDSNLLYGYTFDAVLEMIGNYLETFFKTNSDRFGGSWRKFYRVWVALDVNKLFHRKLKLTKRDGESIWPLFRYEHMHIFYFCCGMSGHSNHYCVKTLLPPCSWLTMPMGQRCMRALDSKEARAGFGFSMVDRWCEPGGFSTANQPNTTTGEQTITEIVGILLVTPKRIRTNMEWVLLIDDLHEVVMIDVPKNLKTMGLVS